MVCNNLKTTYTLEMVIASDRIGTRTAPKNKNKKKKSDTSKIIVPCLFLSEMKQRPLFSTLHKRFINVTQAILIRLYFKVLKT